MWVYQETPETAAAKALPEAIMPTAQEEQLKQKNGGVLPETSQEERQSIPAAFPERCRNTPERAAVRRSKLSRETILLAAAYLLGTFLAGACFLCRMPLEQCACSERNFSLWQVR